MALSDLTRWKLTTDKTLYDYTAYPIFQVIELETTNNFMNYAKNDTMWKKFQNNQNNQDNS